MQRLIAVLFRIFAVPPRRRRQPGRTEDFQTLEPRLVLSTTYSAIYQEQSGSGDTLPAMNDEGVAIYLDPTKMSSSVSQSSLKPTRWMTNGNRVLTGLTSGYWNSSLRLPLQRPQINNAGHAVLVQYLDAKFSQQELVVYDVLKQKRLATVSTTGQLKSIKEVQINQSGQVAAIAEDDAGNGGIYVLRGNRLEPSFVRKGLAAYIDSLTLLDNGSMIFRTVNSAYRNVNSLLTTMYTLKPGGKPVPMMGENRSEVWIQSTLNNSNWENRTGGQQRFVYFNVVFSGNASRSDRPFSVRFKTRDLPGSIGTATAGVDYQPVNTVLTFSGKSSITVQVPIINDDVWEGGAEVFAVDLTPVTDPWVGPIVYMPAGADGTTALGIIHDDSNVGKRSTRIDEPVTKDSQFTVELKPRSNAQPTPFEYAVIPLTATSADVTKMNDDGTIAKGSKDPKKFSVSILEDQSSPLLQERLKHFVIVVKSLDKNARLTFATHTVEIVDSDYIMPVGATSDDAVQLERNRVHYLGHLGVNKNGDVAFLTRDKKKIVVVTDNKVQREISTAGYSEVYTPVVISNNRSIVFPARIGGVHGLYRGADPTKDKVVSVGDALSASNIATSIRRGAYQFGTSDNGTVFFRSISKVYSTPTSWAWRFGIYSTRIARNDLALSLKAVEHSDIMDDPSFFTLVEAVKLANLSGVDPKDMNVGFKLGIRNNGTTVQRGFAIRYRIVLAGVPVDRDIPNGKTMEFRTTWDLQEFPSSVVSPAKEITVRLSTLHPAFNEELKYANGKHIVQASSMTVEFEVTPIGGLDSKPSNNFKKWNAGNSADVAVSSKWMETYKSILDPWIEIEFGGRIWASRPLSLILIKHYLGKLGVSINYGPDSTSAKMIAASKEFKTLVQPGLLADVRKQVQATKKTSGTLNAKPYVDKIAYSVSESDLGTAYRLFDGSSASYSAKITKLASGKSRVKGNIRVNLVDGFNFDFSDARKSKYTFHARVLGLSGNAKPFTVTNSVLIPFSFEIN